MTNACVHKGKVHVRGYAERVPGTLRFRYTCPEGHTHTKDLNAGRPKHLHQGELAAKLYESYWTKERGGVSFDCPKCTKLYKKEK